MNSRGGNNNSSMNGGGSGNAIDTVENKYFLWSFLDEEKVFDGIMGENMQSVVNIFETAINTVKNSHLSVDSNNNNNSDAPVVSAASLAAMNKEVVQRMVVEIPRYKFSMPAPAPAPQPAPPIKMIYKSADIQEARIQDMTSKLKLHEDDMNSFLVLKKPAEINFADERANDDKPIGDEMEQLIQAALASRARELEIMLPTPKVSRDESKNEQVYSNVKKIVSFYEDDDDAETVAVDDDDDKEISTIFNKLKRIENDRQDQEQEQKMYENKRGENKGVVDDAKLGNLLRLLYDMSDALQGVIRAVKVMQSGE
jgi:hypothetical protein